MGFVFSSDLHFLQSRIVSNVSAWSQGYIRLCVTPSSSILLKPEPENFSEWKYWRVTGDVSVISLMIHCNLPD